MKQLLTLLGLSLSMTFGSAFAADAPTPAASATKTAQQGKMATCNKEAADKKGDERKAFMKECLSAKSAAPVASKKTTQQEKMKTCNKDAGDKKLKGDERKAFMKDCLSNKA